MQNPHNFLLHVEAFLLQVLTSYSPFYGFLQVSLKSIECWISINSYYMWRHFYYKFWHLIHPSTAYYKYNVISMLWTLDGRRNDVHFTTIFEIFWMLNQQNFLLHVEAFLLQVLTFKSPFYGFLQVSLKSIECWISINSYYMRRHFYYKFWHLNHPSTAYYNYLWNLLNAESA